LQAERVLKTLLIRDQEDKSAVGRRFSNKSIMIGPLTIHLSLGHAGRSRKPGGALDRNQILVEDASHPVQNALLAVVSTCLRGGVSTLILLDPSGVNLSDEPETPAPRRTLFCGGISNKAGVKDFFQLMYGAKHRVACYNPTLDAIVCHLIVKEPL
jgi:hypothetical protein